MRRRGRGRGFRRKKGRERRERGKKVDDRCRINPEILGREGRWSGIAIENMTGCVFLKQAFRAEGGPNVTKRDFIVI